MFKTNINKGRQLRPLRKRIFFPGSDDIAWYSQCFGNVSANLRLEKQWPSRGGGVILVFHTVFCNVCSSYPKEFLGDALFTRNFWPAFPKNAISYTLRCNETGSFSSYPTTIHTWHDVGRQVQETSYNVAWRRWASARDILQRSMTSVSKRKRHLPT